MSDKKARVLVWGAAIFLIASGVFLYKLFDFQGYREAKQKNAYINYDVNDYVTVTTVTFDNYEDVYDSIDVNRIKFSNIDEELTKNFINEEEELITYIKRYYNEIKKEEEYSNSNNVSTKIKTMVNDTVLSIYYEMDFVFDEKVYENNEKKYILTYNIDLKTMKVLSNDDLLNKYNYTKEYICEKIFNDDVLINDGEVLVDKNTNISLTKDDIARRKTDYINRIVTDYNNIIKMYIEKKSLVLIYDSKDIKNLFFIDDFENNIKTRYLK